MVDLPILSAFRPACGSHPTVTILGVQPEARAAWTISRATPANGSASGEFFLAHSIRASLLRVDVG
jgi:hypothetical protein